MPEMESNLDPLFTYLNISVIQTILSPIVSHVENETHNLKHHEIGHAVFHFGSSVLEC